jgi:DNA repair protein RecO (recombination protein O)
MIITDEAVILHGRKFSDTSKILSIYTLRHGVISVMAKGARASKSKFGSSLEPLSCSTITWYHKPQRDLHLLKSAEISRPFYQLRDSYEKLMTGMALAELITTTQETEVAAPEIFMLLLECMEFLNTESATGNEYACFAFFTLHLAGLMGYTMDFSTCPLSMRSINPASASEFFFSFNNGAVLSPAFSAAGSGGMFLDSALVAILQKMSSLSVQDGCNIPVPARLQGQMHEFFGRYFTFHSDKRFVWKTAPFMAGTAL